MKKASRRRTRQKPTYTFAQQLQYFYGSVEEQQRHEAITALIDKYPALINRFYEVAERKVSLRDEYGDESTDALDKEVDIVVRKIEQKECGMQWSGYGLRESYGLLNYCLSEHLKKLFRKRHEQNRTQPVAQADLSTLTGEEFEVYVMEVLRRVGYTDICGTRATGDQGADILATRNGRKIVIQAKRYNSPVGNGAVQEVAAALRFYDGDEGWVVTNSTFTQAAKELAQLNQISLIDGYNLARLADQANKGN